MTKRKDGGGATVTTTGGSNQKTQTIKLVRDAYGTNARASSIADFVELGCLAGWAPTQAELRDRLKDTGTKIPPAKYVMYNEPDPDVEDDSGDDASNAYADSAQRIVELILERARILGDRYPFELASNRVRLRVSHSGEPYLTLLAMTIAHAHTVPTQTDPKRVFEDVVARVLKTRGWKAGNLAGKSKAQGGVGGFPAALKALCDECELPVDLSQSLVSSSANDEGVDTIAHHSWGDGRAGRWTLIGQATFEKSDGWLKKIREPSSPLFGRLFTEAVQPMPFLAVPHHVEPSHLAKLVQDTGRLVIDRLRLARFDPGVSSEERDILSMVRSCSVEYR